MHAHFTRSELSHIKWLMPEGPALETAQHRCRQPVEIVKGPMVAYMFMNPAPSSTTLQYHTLVQGLEDLDPEAQHVSHANAGGECPVWTVRLILALPEDPGGHVLGGPTFNLVLPRVSDVGAASRSRVKCYRSGPALLRRSPWTLGGTSDIPNWLARLRPDWPSLQLEDSRLVHRGFASNVLTLCAFRTSRQKKQCQLQLRTHGQSILAAGFPFIGFVTLFLRPLTMGLCSHGLSCTRSRLILCPVRRPLVLFPLRALGTTTISANIITDSTWCRFFSNEYKSVMTVI